MIDFNPFSVAKIFFCKKEYLYAFTRMTSAQRAAILENNENYHFEKNFATPERDSETLYESSELNETFYIQEVRINVKANEWLKENVFKNEYILSREYLYAYTYASKFKPERAKFKPKTNLSNRVLAFVRSNGDILYTGLIDLENSSINEDNAEIKTYDQRYLLKLICELEIPLFSLQDGYHYLYGGEIFGTGYDGTELRNPRNLIEFALKSACELFYGNFSTWQLITTAAEASEYNAQCIIDENVFLAMIERMGEDHYWVDFGGGFLVHWETPNVMLAGYYKRFNGTGAILTISCFKYYFTDDYRCITFYPEYVGELDCEDGNQTTDLTPEQAENLFKRIADVSVLKRKLTETVENLLEIEFSLRLGETTDINTRLDIVLKTPLDYDICETNGEGKLLSLETLLKVSCGFTQTYIDHDGIIGFVAKKRKPTVYKNITLDELSITGFKVMNLDYSSFDELDILNLPETAVNMLKIAYPLNYNQNIFARVCEEIEVSCIKLDVKCGELLYVVSGNIVYLVIAKEDVYNSETKALSYLKLKLWKLRN